MTTIAQQIGQVSADIERRSRLSGFLQVARCLLVGGTDRFEVVGEAKRTRLTPLVIEAIETLTKASVAAATTTDATWAAPLAGTQLVDAFAETLRDVSAFDRLLSDFIRVPPAT